MPASNLVSCHIKNHIFCPFPGYYNNVFIIIKDMTDKRILGKNGDIVCDVPEIEADENDGSGVSL